jgi:hypothetical protein
LIGCESMIGAIQYEMFKQYILYNLFNAVIRIKSYIYLHVLLLLKQNHVLTFQWSDIPELVVPNSGAPEGYAVPAPLVAPIMLL